MTRCNKSATKRAVVMAAETLSDAELCASMLEYWEKAWGQSRDQLALVEAITICATFRQPHPKWLVKAEIEAIIKQMTDDERKHHRRRVMHVTRYRLVRRLIEEKNMDRDDACNAVSQQLKNTPFKGKEDAIRRSYNALNRAAKEGRVEQFFWLSDRLT